MYYCKNTWTAVYLISQTMGINSKSCTCARDEFYDYAEFACSSNPTTHHTALISPSVAWHSFSSSRPKLQLRSVDSRLQRFRHGKAHADSTRVLALCCLDCKTPRTLQARVGNCTQCLLIVTRLNCLLSVGLSCQSTSSGGREPTPRPVRFISSKSPSLDKRRWQNSTIECRSVSTRW